MALVECQECTKEISDRAQSCPHCGAPLATTLQTTAEAPKEQSRMGCGSIVFVAILAFVLLLVVVSYMGNTPSGQHSQSVGRTESKPKDPEKQAKRVRLLSDLQSAGVFGSYKCSAFGGEVVARPSFHALDFEDKQRFVSVVYAYCFDDDEKYKSVSVTDSKSGNEIGSFSGVTGLKMKE